MADAIFITGYYRSGTSALAGVLQRCGVALHNDADPNEHNPLGYYEIPELIELDVEIFNRLGVEWRDTSFLPDGWVERADMAPYFARLDEILRRRFSAERLWGIKHPHLCRLLPLYERAARQSGHRPHAVLISRDPWTVAASQHRKNGLSRAHALLLWVSYLVAAERNTRHLPRCWLTYQDMLAAPAAQLRRIGRDLGLDLGGAAAAGLQAATEFLTFTLNRSAASSAAGLAAPLRGLASAVWDAVQARDETAASWDGFAEGCAEIVGLLAEMAESQGPAVPGFKAPEAGAKPHPDPAALRPPERLDEGAKQRLLARAALRPALPLLGVLIAAPPNRAHALNDTLEALRAQWYRPAWIRIIAADPVEIPGQNIMSAPAAAGALTAMICGQANAAADAADADYIALLNAGDTVDPDGCLRFALAAQTRPDMIYCDEVVPADGPAWVRHKPAWDVTRLRQAAYLGDWVWYRTRTVRRLGGFDAGFAGAEEYDFQLRLAETACQVVRLPEAVFRRARLSRRDNIPSTVFGGRAAAALAAHFHRVGIAGTVQPRQHLGLFQHARAAQDPGTAIILLCDRADIPALDRWMKDLLAGPVGSGPIVLAGSQMPPPVANYLAQVAAQAEALAGKVLAVPPAPGLAAGAALRQALALIATPHVAIVDAAALPVTPHWLDALRGRLADPGIALAGGRALVPQAGAPGRFIVHGPIIAGADSRLGAGHFAEDPGPGGWLAVDQEVSAVGPAWLVRRDALARCRIPDLAEDALWADLCAQLRSTGGRIVWTPDVSFVGPAAGAEGSPPGTAEDPYHHPALSLGADPLAAETRFGLIRAAPDDPDSILLSGAADAASMSLLNAARACRGTGMIDAGWAPEPLLASEITRRAAASWIRINPAMPPPPGSPDHTAVFTQLPGEAAQPAILAAAHLAATSPAIAGAVRLLAPSGRAVTLWRPALSRPIWANLPPAIGLNSKPRLLWIDEGFAPPWFATLINETAAAAAWIVVERPGTTYFGGIARLAPPPDEQSWARELSALAPHLLVRPAGSDTGADHYHALLAAAGGSHILADERLDLPAALGAVRLPNRIEPWRDALQHALKNFADTLSRGAAARAACLDLPSVEDAPPFWLGLPEFSQDARRAAE